jgi:hypothetical protein
VGWVMCIRYRYNIRVRDTEPSGSGETD